MRWTDLASWRGPTPNSGQPSGETMTGHRGLVVHIAEGTYDGTIAWQLNPKSQVSSHFIVGRLGQCTQLVDTSYMAWTQKAGNVDWLSVECEGFTPASEFYRAGWEVLTPMQLETLARLFRKCGTVYDTPLVLAAGPETSGLGWHSMGAEYGADWGHRDCPGPAIKNQLPAIVARARQLAGLPATTNGDDVSADDVVVGMSRLFDEMANRNTPTGRNAGNDLAAIIDGRLQLALKPLSDQLSAIGAPVGGWPAAVEAAAEAAVRKVLGAVDGATPPAGS